MATSKGEKLPINIAGSSTFGIYPKISIEKTFNMYLTQGWLCNYAGYKRKLGLGNGLNGRGVYYSARGNFMIAVVGTGVYKIKPGLGSVFIGSVSSSVGGISIAENLIEQICIVDSTFAYIYNYSTNQFAQQTLIVSGVTVRPNYVSFHNGFFLFGSKINSTNSFSWYAATGTAGTTNISINSQNVFRISTKPDTALAAIPLPGRGNNIIVFGRTVAEFFTQVGGTENYRRLSSANLNLGTISVDTIATSDDLVIWLAQNEDEAPVIAVCNGTESKVISTDGISHLLESLSRPDQSVGFTYRQNAHLFYHITFYNEADNLSLIYDFNENKFYHVSDEHQNYYPARQVAYFEGTTYFVSLNDNYLYRMSQQILDYNYDIQEGTRGEVIPRIRIPKTIRKADSERFRVNLFSFWIEQGVTDSFIGSDDIIECDGQLITEQLSENIVTEDGVQILAEDGSCFINPYRPKVDLSFSKNGNQSFSNIVSRDLNSQGNYRNQINWHRMGQANEFTLQLRFWGLQRFVVTDGVLEVY